MTLFEIEDQFYDLIIQIYQAQFLMDGINECGTDASGDVRAQRRDSARRMLLEEVLERAMRQAEAVGEALDAAIRSKNEEKRA